jgi:alkylation response protein AidB-like acyl-CoA dehydrogenase
MNFDLSEEQESFRHVVRDFAEAEIAPPRLVLSQGLGLPVE